MKRIIFAFLLVSICFGGSSPSLARDGNGSLWASLGETDKKIFLMGFYTGRSVELMLLDRMKNNVIKTLEDDKLVDEKELFAVKTALDCTYELTDERNKKGNLDDIKKIVDEIYSLKKNHSLPFESAFVLAALYASGSINYQEFQTALDKAVAIFSKK